MENKYTNETKTLMQLHYSRLSEKERRHYAAIEAQKLGHGGIMYISKLFKTTRVTITKGIFELKNASVYEQIPIGKQRKAGGGRKKNLQKPMP